MKKIREGSFPQKDVFVQYKQKARLSLACISTSLSWDLLQFVYTAMAISTQSGKALVLVKRVTQTFPFFFFFQFHILSFFLKKLIFSFSVVTPHLKFSFCSQENGYCPIANMPFCPLFV